MKQILVVGEDPLTCALGERLVETCLPHWEMPLPAIDKKGVTKLIPDIPRYIKLAQHQPVLCVADTDRHCPLKLLQDWLPKKVPENFILRLAVIEAESWLLADRSGLAGFLGIAEKIISKTPDDESNPKQHLLHLAKKSCHRQLRTEVVSELDRNKQGNGYNTHLRQSVRNHWSATRGAEQSPSLARAVKKLCHFAQKNA